MALVTGLLAAAGVWALLCLPLVAASYPHWFERNPPERKLFLKMLAALAKEEWAWEFTPGQAKHVDTGITVFDWHTVRLPTGEAITFGYQSRGRVILKRIRKIKERADNTASLKARKERDFAALAAMSAAFDKMNAKELH